MTTTNSEPTTTYSVLTPTGRRDVVLAAAETVADLVAAVGLPPTTTLVTAGGVVLAPAEDLERLAGGEVLVVATTPRAEPGLRQGRGGDGETRATAGRGRRSGALPPAGLLWLVAGATAAVALVRVAQLLSGTAEISLLPAVAAGVIALALALLAPSGAAGAGAAGDGASGASAATAVTAATWTSGAAAGLLAVPGDLIPPETLLDAGVSPLLVPGTVALLAAGVATALRYARTHGTPPAVVTGVLASITLVPAAAGVLAVMTGVGGVAVAAVLLGIAPVVVRSLPAASLDVPDHVVVDLSAAQRTATSVRERPVVSPPFVRASTVERSVTTARARRSSAAVLLGVAVTVLAGLVLLAPLPEVLGWADSVQRWATGALGLAVAVALMLVPRQERLAAARLGPRLAAAAVLVLTALWFARVLDAGVLPAVAILAVAVVAVATSLGLGRGWRSVRASRAGDALESFAIALAPALGLLSAGVLGWLRLLASG